MKAPPIKWRMNYRTPPFSLGPPAYLVPPPILRLILCNVRGFYWGGLRASGSRLTSDTNCVAFFMLREKSSGKHHAVRSNLLIVQVKGASISSSYSFPSSPLFYLTLNLHRICRHSHKREDSAELLDHNLEEEAFAHLEDDAAPRSCLQVYCCLITCWTRG